MTVTPTRFANAARNAGFSVSVSARALMRHRNGGALLSLGLAFGTVVGYFLFFFMAWLPSYLQQSYGLNLSAVGLRNRLREKYKALES